MFRYSYFGGGTPYKFTGGGTPPKFTGGKGDTAQIPKTKLLGKRHRKNLLGEGGTPHKFHVKKIFGGGTPHMKIIGIRTPHKFTGRDTAQIPKKNTNAMGWVVGG